MSEMKKKGNLFRDRNKESQIWEDLGNGLIYGAKRLVEGIKQRFLSMMLHREILQQRDGALLSISDADLTHI